MLSEITLRKMLTRSSRRSARLDKRLSVGHAPPLRILFFARGIWPIPFHSRRLRWRNDADRKTAGRSDPLGIGFAFLLCGEPVAFVVLTAAGSVEQKELLAVSTLVL